MNGDEATMDLEKLIQCKMERISVTAVELLSWTCHIEKASFLYFHTSKTLIITCLSLQNDALIPTIEQHNIHFLLDLPVPITECIREK